MACEAWLRQIAMDGVAFHVAQRDMASTWIPSQQAKAAERMHLALKDMHDLGAAIVACLHARPGRGGRYLERAAESIMELRAALDGHRTSTHTTLVGSMETMMTCMGKALAHAAMSEFKAHELAMEAALAAFKASTTIEGAVAAATAVLSVTRHAVAACVASARLAAHVLEDPVDGVSASSPVDSYLECVTTRWEDTIADIVASRNGMALTKSVVSAAIIKMGVCGTAMSKLAAAAQGAAPVPCESRAP